MMRRRPRTERGATSTEYALLIALIAAVITVFVAAIGVSAGDMLNRPCEEFAAHGLAADC
jgi:Flp pilus assembly pilin Flp